MSTSTPTESPFGSILSTLLRSTLKIFDSTLPPWSASSTVSFSSFRCDFRIVKLKSSLILFFRWQANRRYHPQAIWKVHFLGLGWTRRKPCRQLFYGKHRYRPVIQILMIALRPLRTLSSFLDLTLVVSRKPLRRLLVTMSLLSQLVAPVRSSFSATFCNTLNFRIQSRQSFRWCCRSLHPHYLDQEMGSLPRSRYS